MLLSLATYVGTIILLIVVTTYSRRALSELMFLIFESKKAGVVIYSVLYFPGTIIHEMSHFLMAAFTGVRTGKITLFPNFEENDGRIHLGSVEVERTDFFRSSLIGAAPFIVGTVGLVYLSSILGLLQSNTIFEAIDSLKTGAGSTFFWFKIYLLLAISNTLFTSKEDRRHWPIFIVFITSITLILFGIGAKFSAPDTFVSAIQKVITASSTSFLIAISLNSVFFFIFKATIGIVGKITHKKIVYKR